MSLTACLRRTAFFAETHSIKGWLAAERLSKRFPQLEAFGMGELGQWNQLLSAPAVEALLGAQVSWERAELEDERLRAMLRGAVFPMAYVAAVELAHRHGLRALIEADNERALLRLGNLGHSYTIHKSFLEVVAHLESEEQRDLCAERYAELVASQLAQNDGSKEDEQVQLDGPETDERHVVDRVFAQPGYLGHTAITLGYLLRYRDELDAPRWRFALQRLAQMTRPSVNDARELVAQGVSSESSERSLSDAIEHLIRYGSREVHTVTLADAACDLWDRLPERRAAVEEMLLRFAGLVVERTASGERKR